MSLTPLLCKTRVVSSSSSSGINYIDKTLAFSCDHRFREFLPGLVASYDGENPDSGEQELAKRNTKKEKKPKKEKRQRERDATTTKCTKSPLRKRKYTRKKGVKSEASEDVSVGRNIRDLLLSDRTVNSSEKTMDNSRKNENDYVVGSSSTASSNIRHITEPPKASLLMKKCLNAAVVQQRCRAQKQQNKKTDHPQHIYLESLRSECFSLVAEEKWNGLVGLATEIFNAIEKQDMVVRNRSAAWIPRLTWFSTVMSCYANQLSCDTAYLIQKANMDRKKIDEIYRKWFPSYQFRVDYSEPTDDTTSRCWQQKVLSSMFDGNGEMWDPRFLAEFHCSVLVAKNKMSHDEGREVLSKIKLQQDHVPIFKSQLTAQCRSLIIIFRHTHSVKSLTKSTRLAFLDWGTALGIPEKHLSKAMPALPEKHF